MLTPETQSSSPWPRWEDHIQVSPDIMGGEPVFAGTRLTVRHVGGMLLRGGSAEEILEDYPYLTQQDLELARRFAEVSPNSAECTEIV